MNDKAQTKRILVTGASGFLGRAVLASLTEKNYEVVATQSSEHDLTKIEDCVRATEGIDTVVHLAGLVLSRSEQQKRPAEVFYSNTVTTLNIAEAARINSVRRVLFTSSVTAYPDNATPPFAESALWSGPLSNASYAYGTAKRITETIARAYSDQYGTQTCTLFFPNLYGPGDKFTYNPPPLIPNIIKQIHAASLQQLPSIQCGNNGETELDLLYVDDAASALACALENDGLPTALNISTGTTVKIKDVYAAVANVLSYKGAHEWEQGSAVPPPRTMDGSLAKKHLAWRSATSFETGINNTITSYLATL